MSEPADPQPSTNAVLDREERYRFLIENIPVQIWTALPDGLLDYVSHRTAHHLGVTPEQLLREGWQNVVHPDDLPLAVERWTHALQRGTVYEVEFRLKVRSGHYAWHLARAVPQRDSEGRVLQWFGTNTDIEEQRSQRGRIETLLQQLERQAAELSATNELLRQREASLATTLASIGDGIVATDVDACITFVNPVAEQLTSWALAEVVGRPLATVFRIINEQSRTPVESPVERALRDGTVVALANDTLLIRKDGQEVPVDDIAAPIRTANDEVTGVILVFRDVTARKCAERERERLLLEAQSARAQAQAEREQQHALFMQAPLPIAILEGPQHLFTFANPAYRALVNGRDVVGKPLADALPDIRDQGFDRLLNGVMASGETFFGREVRIKLEHHAEGESLVLNFVYTPKRNGAGEIDGVLMSGSDVTELVTARERAVSLAEQRQADLDARAQQAAFERQLIGIVSHDLRNPLNARRDRARRAHVAPSARRRGGFGDGGDRRALPGEGACRGHRPRRRRRWTPLPRARLAERRSPTTPRRSRRARRPPSPTRPLFRIYATARCPSQRRGSVARYDSTPISQPRDCVASGGALGRPTSSPSSVSGRTTPSCRNGALRSMTAIGCCSTPPRR